jgi:hypothetical protein
MSGGIIAITVDFAAPLREAGWVHFTSCGLFLVRFVRNRNLDFGGVPSADDNV